MPRPKRSLIVMTSHADMGVSGKKTGKSFDEGGDPVLRVSRGGLPGSAELSSGWIGTDRSSEWALAVHDREHRPVPRGLGGDAGAEGNGEPERNRLPQLRRLFVSGRLRATVGAVRGVRSAVKCFKYPGAQSETVCAFGIAQNRGCVADHPHGAARAQGLLNHLQDDSESLAAQGGGRWPRWPEAGFAGDAPSAVGTRYTLRAQS